MAKWIAAFVALAWAAAQTFACDKKAEYLFINHTNDPVELTIKLPGKPAKTVGQLPAHGKLTICWKTSKCKLPGVFAWRAGQFSGQWVVERDTIECLAIPVGPNQAGPEVPYPGECTAEGEAVTPGSEEVP